MSVGVEKATRWKVLLFTAVVVLGASAKAGSAQSAVRALRKAHPEITWNVKSAVSADVNCDGKPEVIVLGADKNDRVVVAIVSSGDPRQQQLLSFPIRSSTQDGFCSVPNRVEISPLECRSEEGTLPGCKQVAGCQEFAVSDGMCDGFNFYWDASQKRLAWWRN